MAAECKLSFGPLHPSPESQGLRQSELRAGSQQKRRALDRGGLTLSEDGPCGCPPGIGGGRWAGGSSPLP